MTATGLSAREIVDAATPRLNGYIPLDPTEKQSAFLLLMIKEALYGGAAGPGKSVALLMAALQFVDIPKYRAIILRKTFQELTLPGNLLEMSHEWLEPTDAYWQAQRRRWFFPASGATLTFGGLEHERDRRKYKGAAFHFIGIDQLEEFFLKEYLFLMSRLRKKKDDPIPLRIRGTANPGGPGHEWILERFVEPPEGDDAIWFIPGTIDDNPHLDREEYELQLMHLDPVTRARLMKGDWSVRDESGMFRRGWFRRQKDPPAAADLDSIVRYWDLASSTVQELKDPDYTAGVLMAKAKGKYYLIDVTRTRGTPGQVDDLMLQTAHLDASLYGKRVQIHEEQEPGASGKALIHHHRRILAGFAHYGDKKDKATDVRAAPFASQAEAGNVVLIDGPWNKAYLDEQEAYPNGAHDDQVVASSGAFAKLTSGSGLFEHYRRMAEELRKKKGERTTRPARSTSLTR